MPDTTAIETRLREAFDQFSNIYIQGSDEAAWLLRRRLARLCDEVTRIALRENTEIAKLRGLVIEMMNEPEAAYHGDWFARATEALPDAID